MTDEERKRAEKIKRFVRAVSINPRDPRWHDYMEISKHPEIKKRGKIVHDIALNINEAYANNGPRLHVDQKIRYFLAEYNSRVLLGYGDEQPTSFNIMNAFVEPSDEALILELVEEKYYQFDITDFLDKLTSNRTWKKKFDSAFFLPHRIYEYNQFGMPTKIDLPDLDNILFAGTAVTRTESVFSIFSFFGEYNLEDGRPVELKKEDTYKNRQDLFTEGEYNSNNEVFFGIQNYSPLILLIDFDIENGNFLRKYVLKERQDFFMVLFDDAWVLDDIRENFPDRLDSTIKNNELEIIKYNSLFELINYFPLLAEYTVSLEDSISIERHPTNFRMHPSGKLGRISKKFPKRSPKYREVYNLNTETQDKPKRFDLKAQGFKRETSGYWKTLPPNTVGANKAGDPIHGKSWVTKDLSWLEFAQDSGNKHITVHTGPISENENVGYVYILRSASHANDIFKIGFTTKLPEQRASELSNTTGQPDKFLVVHQWKVSSPRRLEKEIHDRLNRFRLNNNREFFRIKYANLHKEVEESIKALGLELMD